MTSDGVPDPHPEAISGSEAEVLGAGPHRVEPALVLQGQRTEELQRHLVGDLELAFGHAAHHAVVDRLPVGRSAGEGEVEQGVGCEFGDDALLPHHPHYRFSAVIDNWIVVARDTHTKYGTWATATQR